MDSTPGDVSTLFDRLCRMGDPSDTRRWDEGEPDYVAELGLRAEHVPALIEIVRKRAEPGGLSEDTWAAPIHAWRALGQLRAVEAVEPLLAMQDRLDERRDDWFIAEFFYVFGLVGAAALPALNAYLADRSHTEFARVVAANGLCEIGKRHPETRPEVVDVLTRRLAEHEPGVYSLNAFLIGNLADLKAVESAEVIERAFAASVVDEMVCGGWTVIREELGVPGLGLAADRLRAPRPHFGLAESSGEPVSADREGRDRQRQEERKAKAKRKQQKKARNRNRKRR